MLAAPENNMSRLVPRQTEKEGTATHTPFTTLTDILIY